MIKRQHNPISDNCVSAGVNLLLLKSGAHCNIRDLAEVAATIAKTQNDLANAMETVQVISDVIAVMDLHRIEAALGHVRAAKTEAVPGSTATPPENGRFAVDRATRDEIRYRHSIGVPMRRLSDDFGVSRRTIGRYISNV